MNREQRRAARYKRAHRYDMHSDVNDYTARNPVAHAALRQRIEGDIAALRTRAGLQAHLSDDAIRMADACGRLVYVVAHAARQHNLQDTPEARILAGTANALADIVAAPGSLEQHRASVLSGLSACERLLPQLHTWALALGAQELDGILGTRDFTTGDVRAALGVEAA